MREAHPVETLSRREIGRPSMAMGAVVGALTVLGFVIVHGLWIADIWFNAGPMLFSGALCGVSVVWSYNIAVEDHSPVKWLAYNGSYVTLLVALGGVSYLVLEPRFTMAEVVDNPDALGILLPRATPLMIAATLVGTGSVWTVFGRQVRAIGPILVTQALLVFLIGHNLAILGLVELTSDLLPAVWNFLWLTLFLGGVFAGGVAVVARHIKVQKEPRPVA